MKTFLIVCLLTLNVLAQSQQEMNAQARADFERADKELNVVYKQLTAALSPEEKDKLVTAELLWIKLRDADAAARAASNEGGSIYPLIYEGNRAASTRERVKYLREWLDELKDR